MLIIVFSFQLNRFFLYTVELSQSISLIKAKSYWLLSLSYHIDLFIRINDRIVLHAVIYFILILIHF